MKSRSQDLPWIGAVILLFALLWAPLIKFQPPLTAGDMGRDLYAFWMTFEGKWPCRDYWWSYGPLMPLYYAFWFLIGGVSLLSVRMGLGVLFLICSLLSYRTLRLLTSPPVAFLFSLAFLNLDVTYSLHHVRLRDMAYTFNQYGAFPFLLLSLGLLWKYFMTGKIRWVYFGAASLAGVALVKVSAGLASGFAFFASLWLFQFRIFPFSQKGKGPGEERTLPWRHRIFPPLLFGSAVALSYGLLYRGIPSNWVSQCLTAGPSYHGGDFSPGGYFKHLILWFLVWDRRRLLWLMIFVTFLVLASVSFKRKKIPAEDRHPLFWAGLSSLLFGAANSLDYFVDGSIHRVDFWFFPTLVLLTGLGAEQASLLFSRRIKRGLGVLILTAMLTFPILNLKEALAWRVPERYLDLAHGQVYLGGNIEEVKALKEGSRWISEQTSPEQEILAVPYEPLYSFLSGRRHAVRELLFAENMHISQEQEDKILQALEAKQVSFVVVSNRDRSGEWGMGRFGVTHCRKLADTLARQFEDDRVFGAVRILRRKR